MSRLVTTGEAATALGVSPVTLQRWARAGHVLPAYRTPGGHLRWDIDDLRVQVELAPPPEVGGTDRPEPLPVVAAIVTSERGVLVGKRVDGTPAWTFIAGEIEPRESPADAAVREVKEETGLEVRPLRLIGRRVHPRTGRTMIYMSASPVHGLDVFVGDERELSEVRWASLSEAEELLPGMFEPVRAYLARVLG